MIALAALGFANIAQADATAEITTLEHKVANSSSADEALSYLRDDVVVYDTWAPLQFNGKKAIRTDLEAAYANFKSPPKVDFISLKVIPAGDIAVAYSIQHLTAADKAGKPLDYTFRETDVWRKEKGEWKIVHSHISFPVDMATGKTVFQSK